MCLINADVFIEYINNRFTIFNDDFVELINAQPTAYCPEEVVKQLEEYKYSKENLYVGKVVAAIIDYAIEIVKGGIV